MRFVSVVTLLCLMPSSAGNAERSALLLQPRVRISATPGALATVQMAPVLATATPKCSKTTVEHRAPPSAVLALLHVELCKISHLKLERHVQAEPSCVVLPW